VSFRRFAESIGEEIEMTEQSLSTARNKIKWEAFAEIFEATGVFAYTGDYDRWNGYRIWAIDGSKMALPNHPSLSEVFGHEKGSPTAMASVLYDVLNYTVVDAQIESVATDERTLAMRHIDNLAERMKADRELIIFDRGYPSEEIIDSCVSKGLFYLMRARRKFNLDADNQRATDGHIRIGRNDVRVIKVVLDTGETEVLLTNLAENFDFKELYFKRWGIEKEFDVLKNTLGIENFSGRTETAVKQDFFIHMIASNILAAAYWEAQEIVDKERNTGENKHNYKVNTAQAAGAVRDYLVPAILTVNKRKRKRLLKKMHETIASSVVPIRPDRLVARNKNNRNAKFHHNRKPNL